MTQGKMPPPSVSSGEVVSSGKLFSTVTAPRTMWTNWLPVQNVTVLKQSFKKYVQSSETVKN